jgi:hypothetical protein
LAGKYTGGVDDAGSGLSRAVCLRSACPAAGTAVGDSAEGGGYDSTETFGSVGSGSYKWIGGVLAPNGQIYGIPYSSAFVLKIGPSSSGSASLTCAPCPVGQFLSPLAATSFAPECIACPASQTTVQASATSSSACVCAAGRFGAPSGGGQDPCAMCLVGTFAAAAGASACEECPAGKYTGGADGAGSAHCSACASGKYQDEMGQVVCKSCEAGRVGTGGSPSSSCSGQCAAGSWSL